ncbi:hypothetical protein BpHYR1_054272 [Brachionus plicatilis]|uniref:Uncharacterized protein n=1 Tax=Brachionus plicatilis TaxID=10195 RepID=A0A3M7R701_BRAPC|nr:hypothetical protein BpHYR1_054272 [Brachionus plicatilis]
MITDMMNRQNKMIISINATLASCWYFSSSFIFSQLLGDGAFIWQIFFRLDFLLGSSTGGKRLFSKVSMKTNRLIRPV